MIPFVPIRKCGKLPGEVIQRGYTKEYGDDTIEIQKESLNSESRVLVVDDLLATGGSLNMAIELVKLTGAQYVGSFCIFELVGLEGWAKLEEPDKLVTLMKY